MRIGFQDFDPVEEFKKDKVYRAAKKAFSVKKAKPNPVTDNPLEKAKEKFSISSIGLKANQDRLAGKGPSLAETRSEIRGTREHLGRFFDEARGNAPTYGKGQDNDRRLFIKGVDQLFSDPENLDEDGRLKVGVEARLKANILKNHGHGAGQILDEYQSDPGDENAQAAAAAVNLGTHLPAQITSAPLHGIADELTQPGSPESNLVHGTAGLAGMALTGGFGAGAGLADMAGSVIEGGASEQLQGIIDTVKSIGDPTKDWGTRTAGAVNIALLALGAVHGGVRLKKAVEFKLDPKTFDEAVSATKEQFGEQASMEVAEVLKTADPAEVARIAGEFKKAGSLDEQVRMVASRAQEIRNANAKAVPEAPVVGTAPTQEPPPIPSKRSQEVQPPTEAPVVPREEVSTKEPWEMTRDTYSQGGTRFWREQLAATDARKANAQAGMEIGSIRSQTGIANKGGVKANDAMFNRAAKNRARAGQANEEGNALDFKIRAASGEEVNPTGNKRVATDVANAITEAQQRAKADAHLHREMVEKAIAEGKPVPPEVLADYPDLEPVQSTNAGESPGTRASGAANDAPVVPLGDKGSLGRGASDVTKNYRIGSGGDSAPAESTGLANQVQERESLSGVLREVEGAKGKSPEAWQKIGKERVEAGADPESLARRIGDGSEELTGEKVGILLEGKRKLLKDLEAAKDRFDEGTGSREDIDTAQTKLDDYVQNVQAGKGRWSDVGRALQAGTQLDTGNFAEVLQVAKRTGRLDAKVEAELKDLTDQVAAGRAEIERLKANPSEFEARQKISQTRQRRFNREEIKSNIESNRAKLKELVGTGGVGSKKTRGSVTRITAEDLRVAKDRAIVIRDIALDHARLAGATLEDVVIAVQKMLKDDGIDIDRDAVIQALATVESKPKSVSAEAEAAANVRGEARKIANLKGAITEKEGQLKTGLRIVRKAPKERTVTQEIEDLQAKDKILDSRVRSKLKELDVSTGRRVARNFFTGIRGMKLGRDFGIALRQGLFGLARPKAFAAGLKSAKQTMFSEVEMVKWAEANETKRYSDGKLAAKVRKDSGLSVTDALNTHEEMVLPKIARKVLGDKFGGSLERGQTAFINTLRSEMFDSFYEKGASQKELQSRARYINNVTGRGNVKNVPEDLSIILTSPRFEASRWGTIGESVRNFNFKDAGQRANLQDMVVTAATVVAFCKTAELAGYSFNWQDPKKSDFLKLRKGEEVWDVTAGIAPRLRDIIVAFGAFFDPGYRDNLTDVAAKTVTRTFSPGLTVPAKMVSSNIQTARGSRKPIDPISGFPFKGHENDLLGLILTLGEANTLESYEKSHDVAKAAVTYLKEFFGTGVNFYPDKKPKPFSIGSVGKSSFSVGQKVGK